MDRLWAPWRTKYISGQSAREVPEGECVLCQKRHGGPDAENLVLHRGDLCFLMMNLYPYSNGHLMVLPNRHVGQFGKLTGPERQQLMDLAEVGMAAVEQALKPDGFNLGMNIGRVAGAGIEDHLHLHIVPRWNGDTNFMPVLGETRVISEGLRETYGKLRCALRCAADDATLRGDGLCGKRGDEADA